MSKSCCIQAVMAQHILLATMCTSIAAAASSSGDAAPNQQAALLMELNSATLLFLEHMSNWMLTRHPDQWEQAAFNEVIRAHVIGRAHQAPSNLRYRILLVELFLNIPTFHLRWQEKLDVAGAVIVHAGGVHGRDKEKQMQDLGIWAPEYWQPHKGAPFIQMLYQLLDGL